MLNLGEMAVSEYRSGKGVHVSYTVGVFNTTTRVLDVVRGVDHLRICKKL